MRLFRNRFVIRSLSLLFLFVFLQSVFLPDYALAVTTGPHQPEYISYEEPGATDMVNLLTGDFTFNLPVLEVPGPEGGFSLPLSYHAGVGLEQEASWVGLGCNMNAGAITRSINEFPDDANGESHSITVRDLTGVRGWTSSALGFGQLGWNTMQGHYGSISLFGVAEINYDNTGISSVGVAGISVSGNGIGIDLEKMAGAIMSVGLTMMSAGTSNVGAIAKQTVAVGGIAIGAALSTVMPAATPGAFAAGNWEYSKKVDRGLFHTDYWIWLDQTRSEKMYGTMYLGNSTASAYSDPDVYTTINLSVNSQSTGLNYFTKSTQSPYVGSASDMSQHINLGFNYHELDNPAVLAPDSYSVKAPGISGSIVPYRLDIGSVSMPREMTATHERLSTISFLNNYKVPFVYQGSPSNAYYHHAGGASSVQSPSFYFGASSTNSSDANGWTLNFNLNDVIFQNQRVSPSISNYRIPMANHVEWLSNEDFLDEGKRTAAGLQDFLAGSARTTFRQNISAASPYQAFGFFAHTNDLSSTLSLNTADAALCAVNDIVDLHLTIRTSGQPDQFVNLNGLSVTGVTSNSITCTSGPFAPYLGSVADIEIALYKTQNPAKAIGGYAITNSSGVTNHFSLPVYDFEQLTTIKDIADPNNKYTTLNRFGGFANTWLLTAITGPDYVDRGPGGTANGIVDDYDWGYWVKLNYGRHSTNFQWRIPYSGDKRDPGNTSLTNTVGKKQMYYLNSIETRSHVALFVKEARADSRAANSVLSLKLNEVCLVTKETYKTLTTSYSLPDFSIGIDNVCTTANFSGAQTYTYQNVLRRIVFTHTYDLCPGTPNSTSNGKLTLTRLSVMGRNSAKVTPDYLFEYGGNPSYDVNKWDGWGVYSSQATQSFHQPSTVDSDAAVWSLTKVTTPLGNQITINYERDTYSSMSGLNLYDPIVYGYNESRTQAAIAGLAFLTPSAGTFAVNDPVLVDGTWTLTCPGGQPISGTFSSDRTIAAINGNVVTLNSNVGSSSQCGGASVSINYYGTIRKRVLVKKGGDERVASIVLTDQGKEFKTRYIYTADDGNSSGVVTREPEYIKTQELEVFNIPGYPSTPVMYSKVSVLTGKLSNDTDFHTKKVYRFQAPSTDMITYVRDAPANKLFTYSKSLPLVTLNYYWTLSHHKIEYNTSKIGRLNSVEVYDQLGLRSQSQLTYTDQLLNGTTNAYQGNFTSGTLIFDKVLSGQYSTDHHYRFSRTTTISHPNVLSKVTNTKDGFVSESENLSWDFISSAVDSKIERSALGLNIKTVIKPVYTLSGYSEMGSKAINLSNKNMLGQVGATYAYKTDPTGATIYGLVSGTAQTWKKDWGNYRVLNTGAYSDQTEGPNVWRKSAAYVYKGTYATRQADGTLSFSGGNEFNFSNPGNNPLWQYAGEAKRFDHFSMPLESVDLNNIPSSVKMGYGDKLKVAEAGNAAYTEMTFSSAEDLNTTTNFFGGEVALGSGTVVTTGTHTGSSSLSLSTGYGFVYKPTWLKANRTYRAAVWSNSANGRLYYKLNGGGEQLSAAPTQYVGSWYLSEIQVPVTSFTSLEVGVKSASGTILFDDFRFQPLDAAMSASVYNSRGELEYSLDNNNLFTRYEYNDRGILIKTYSESIKFNGVKLLTESKDNYRRFNTQQ